MIPCAPVDREESKKKFSSYYNDAYHKCVIRVRHNAVSRFALNFFSVDYKEEFRSITRDER